MAHNERSQQQGKTAMAASREEEAWRNITVAAEVYKARKGDEENGREFSKSWWALRPEDGVYYKIFQEMKVELASFKANFRLTPELFEYLLKLVSPFILGIDTQLRESISAG